MKLAKLNNLRKQDELFLDGEPSWRYNRRSIIVVDDSYDFVANDATDISSITNWIIYHKKSKSRQEVVESMQSTITDWSTHDQDEKDMFLTFSANTTNPTITSDQRNELKSMIHKGFTIFEKDGTNVKRYWDGSAWV